jgi:hypothetical protein
MHFYTLQRKNILCDLHLQLLKSVTTPLKLGVVCNRLAMCQYYPGIVDLCLAEARKLDPHNLAQHFHTQGQQQDDTQGMQAYISRYAHSGFFFFQF